jgi:hypothetical protein
MKGSSTNALMPNEMNKDKEVMFKEYINDFNYFELKRALIKGKMWVLKKQIKGGSNVEANTRKIAQLKKDLEQIKPMI